MAGSEETTVGVGELVSRAAAIFFWTEGGGGGEREGAPPEEGEGGGEVDIVVVVFVCLSLLFVSKSMKDLRTLLG